VGKSVDLLFVIFLALFLIVIFSVSVSAMCWQYATQPSCESTTDEDICKWKSDAWGSWCEEVNCWSLYTQSECDNSSLHALIGKSCSWRSGGPTYSCEKVSCWGFSGTNESTCESNSQGLNCEWNNYCNPTGYNPGTDCWSKNNSADCMNTSGCGWGQCMEKGCWSYNNISECGAAKDWNGRNCTWDAGEYCAENGCWKYSNESACTSASGISCEWKWNSCQDAQCWKWDFTNESACMNNSLGLSCLWSGSYCNQKDCWAYSTSGQCSQQQNCVWKQYVSSGWCQEAQCWNWDSYNGGNKTLCENEDENYNLECVWSGNPSGNETNGWCYKDTSGISCSNITTEKKCMDTYYCWWQYNDWNNVSAGGFCNTPGGFGGGQGDMIFNEWNPGCYMFDMNSSDCNRVLGCNYTNGVCDELEDEYGQNITEDGISCSYINDSILCNNIPMLSSCCMWQNGTCREDKFSTSCKDQMQASPEGASFCEDYNSFTSQALCEQIAGNPWYMPCKWNNSTERCEFKADDVFGNSSQSLTKIDNKKNCEAAAGKWISENYCEGNVSVPSGRCEYKFDGEENCDKACFACELKNSEGNSVNASNAESACLGSKLGFCEFYNNTNAPNGIGFCKAKEQFKKGIAGDCNINCGDCTYKGDASSTDNTKRPEYFCFNSKANSDGGGCKWVSDSSAGQGGYCVKKGEKTCEDACDRCNSQDDCANIGRTAISNQSGSCKWEGDSNTGSCVSNTGEDIEICWDGIDNTDDNLVDCADPGCYADSFCGLVEGNCFGWISNNTCIENDCEWVTDKWGGWCDFKGSQCWKYDSNEANCSVNENCQWHNGTGFEWCERDWEIAEVCMGLDSQECMAMNVSGCNWTTDSWCQGQGNGTQWCEDFGGWCDHQDFKPKDCWMYQSGPTECNAASGCNWKADLYSLPHCEADWSVNCWQNNDGDSCESAGCWWRTDQWGSWCTNIMDKCWSSTTAENCSSQTDGNGDAICYWESWGNFCQPLCFNSSSLSNSSCSQISGCVWKDIGGWCEETSSCNNESNSNNATGCQATDGCKWKSSGYCDPKNGGFSTGAMTAGGGGGGMGGECYKYDGNETLCTNKDVINISCSWFAEPNAKCEVDWGQNCWQYMSVEAGCNESNGCWWNQDQYNPGNGWCTNVMDQCWSNQSLQDPVACDANPYCINNSWGGCEPECFSKNITSCSSGSLAGKCKWISGWCNPAGMNAMFDGMEAGAPAPLGMDACGEPGVQASIDICGFGMKDMIDSYGFGLGVYDFSNASICNKETLSSFVMGMVGSGMPGGGGMGASSGGGVGGGGGFGEERVGSGTDTIKYFVYLDTDGSTSGGCSLSHNSSQEGYEFRFKYVSEWNENTSKASETFNAYKCENSEWKATDIKLSAWKKLMCSEIGGPMIAVEKADLERFPSLYDSTKDIRVYVSTAGSAGSVSNVSDSAGPGWATPGATDFEINDIFGYGIDTAKFEDILKYGFVKGEDCFNTADDDDDGSADCDDWDCEYSSNCYETGVNEGGYADTRTPQVVGVKIEEYPDAALIMYDTNKPTNGTLELYGYGDTRCLNRSNIISDIGILNNNTIREYKTWHTALIYDANDTNISLNWPLAAGSTYNYKLKVCDSSGRCAVSKCSSFKLPDSVQKCGYCNFVTRIKAPTGWLVKYDADRNGTYEHIQGQVCGPNAGMKMNYTMGRNVNIRLEKSDGSVYIEFVNASLTKTGLNDKVRTISESGALIDDDEGFVGMPSETRDKIINNLHPEMCRVKIPSSGTCDTLYHCDDSGENCVDRTAAAGGAPIDATNCIWNVPFCEFSTYREALPSGGDDGGDGGGSGGGGSGSGGGGAGGGASTTPSASSAGTGAETTSAEPKAGTPVGEGTSKEIGRLKLWLWSAGGAVIVVTLIMILFKFFKRDSY